MPHFIGRIETTRIGRYAGGERYQLTRKHPIIQFLTNPNFEFSPDLPHDNPQFMSNNGLWCAKIPEGSTPSPPRIKQLGERGILVLDVGCSTGANLLLLEDFLQEVADKDVKVKGYENCESRLTEARAGLAEYHTTESLLHPRVREAVKRYFIETKKFDPVFEYDETTFYYALRKEFTGRFVSLLADKVLNCQMQIGAMLI